ncbi:spore germination protein [Paenibacillus gansuensis]|uniref:Spore germination protein n=1 Tax=Paenibacillus gansuensis TaxID=306542 RepID=A0ABW5PGD9_9BACL
MQWLFKLLKTERTPNRDQKAQVQPPHAPLFSPELREKTERLKARMGDSSDLVTRGLTVQWPPERMMHIEFHYVDGLVDSDLVQKLLIGSVMDRKPPANQPDADPLQLLSDYIINAGQLETVNNEEDALFRLVSGQVLCFVDTIAPGLAIALPGMEDRGVSESKAQTVVRGPQDAFTETLRTNTSLVRRRIKDPRMRVVELSVGTVTKTNVALLYIRGVADEQMVEKVLESIRSIPLESVLEGQYVEEFIRDPRGSLFPTVLNTERPDSVSAALVEGRIAIIVDGTPFVLIVPALFLDFIQSAEDYYQPYIYSNFIRMIRILTLFGSMLAPSFYIAVTTFHQDLLPSQLLFSLAAQREGVPFPAFIEALLMEVTFEILREAGIRMPRTIGQAVSIVGTLVIGQAAVEAGIVSAAMVIVVAITAITSFVMPSYNLSIAIRLSRFLFMAAAASFGIYGIVIGLLILITHLCSLRSQGIPYMAPYAPKNKKETTDALFRIPFSSKNRQNPKGGLK